MEGHVLGPCASLCQAFARVLKVSCPCFCQLFNGQSVTASFLRKHPPDDYSNIMDLVNQLMTFTLGVEPNKEALQGLASTLQSAGQSSVCSRLKPLVY